MPFRFIAAAAYHCIRDLRQSVWLPLFLPFFPLNSSFSFRSFLLSSSFPSCNLAMRKLHGCFLAYICCVVLTVIPYFAICFLSLYKLRLHIYNFSRGLHQLTLLCVSFLPSFVAFFSLLRTDGSFFKHTWSRIAAAASAVFIPNQTKWVALFAGR